MFYILISYIFYNVAEFCMNFKLSIIVLCVVLSSTIIMANPDISSINGASTLIDFCTFGFNTIHSFGKLVRIYLRN